MGEDEGDVEAVRHWNWTTKLPFDRDRVNPLPFPGVYPTRWKIELLIRIGKGSKAKYQGWSYLGKPSTEVARFVREQINSKKGYIRAWEFDRGGVIKYSKAAPLPCEYIPVEDWAERAHRFYYPWNNHPELICNWSYEFNRLPVKWQGKKWMVYAQAEVGTALLEGYKQWLSIAGLKFGK